MGNECIFDIYFKNKIVLCTKEYKCQGCKIQSEIKEVIQAIAVEMKQKELINEKMS